MEGINNFLMENLEVAAKLGQKGKS